MARPAHTHHHRFMICSFRRFAPPVSEAVRARKGCRAACFAWFQVNDRLVRHVPVRDSLSSVALGNTPGMSPA